MTHPAYAASREPVSHSPRYVADAPEIAGGDAGPHGRNPVCGILPEASGPAKGPQDRGAASPAASGRTVSHDGAGHAFRKLAGSTARVFLARPGICQEEERFEDSMPLHQGTPRARVGVCGCVRSRNGVQRPHRLRRPPRAVPGTPKEDRHFERRMPSLLGKSRVRALGCTKCTDFAPRPPTAKGRGRTNGRQGTGQKGLFRSWTGGA